MYHDKCCCAGDWFRSLSAHQKEFNYLFVPIFTSLLKLKLASSLYRGKRIKEREKESKRMKERKRIKERKNKWKKTKEWMKEREKERKKDRKKERIKERKKE